MPKGTNRSQKQVLPRIMRSDSRSPGLGTEDEADAGVGGIAGMKKDGMQMTEDCISLVCL